MEPISVSNCYLALHYSNCRKYDQAVLGRLIMLPAVFVSHGGGPLPVLGDPGNQHLATFLRGLPQKVSAKPTAILVVSAHWEESVATVTASKNPPMIYDYYGFPPESYKLKYPAPGDPALAGKVASLLRSAGINCNEDPTRGLDHGAYIPLLLAYPEADIPVLQLSLEASLDPERHLRIGEALAPLREQGVLLLASGLSFHNMSVFQRAMMAGPAALTWRLDAKSEQFDEALRAAMAGEAVTPEERRKWLVEWATKPQARFAHPREEHLLPLMVAAGSAMNEPGEVWFSGPNLGAKVSCFGFGSSGAQGKEEL